VKTTTALGFLSLAAITAGTILNYKDIRRYIRRALPPAGNRRVRSKIKRMIRHLTPAAI
jgi:hypothetical protein